MNEQCLAGSISQQGMLQVMPEMRQARAQVAAAPEVKAEAKEEPMDTLEGAGSVPMPIPDAIIGPVTATIAGQY